MARNLFIDPAGNRPTYPWQINHSDEDEGGKARSIEESANTGGTGLVKQQADDQPIIFNYSGTILHKAQLVEFWAWFQLCATQTIYFTDFAGDEYEVLITAFKPTRHRTIRNPRDFANAPLWYWKYTISIEVIRVISGVMEGVSP